MPATAAYLIAMARVIRQRRAIESDEQAGNRQTASLAALAVLLALLVASLLVMRALNTRAVIEDCLLAGRRDCDAVVIQQAHR